MRLKTFSFYNGKRYKAYMIDIASNASRLPCLGLILMISSPHFLINLLQFAKRKIVLKETVFSQQSVFRLLWQSFETLKAAWYHAWFFVICGKLDKRFWQPLSTSLVYFLLINVISISCGHYLWGWYSELFATFTLRTIETQRYINREIFVL